MLMSSLPSLLFSAAGQVDEEETEAKKGIQMENKLQKRWLLLERRKDTQRGVAGGGEVAAIVAWARPGCTQVSQKSVRSRF